MRAAGRLALLVAGLADSRHNATVTAVVFLSQVEADLVSQGRLAEPGFRPHPRAAVHEDGADDDLDYEPSSPPPNFGKAEVLEHVARAHYWARYSYERALLVSANRGIPEATVIGVAVAAGGPRLRVNGVRRLLVGPWRYFGWQVPVASIIDDLPDRHSATLERILREGHSRPLPQGLSAALNRLLSDYVSDYRDLLASLPYRPPIALRRTQQPALLDANLTALRFFSRRWRDLEPVPASPPSAFTAEIELATRGSENDYITDDTAEFLGWDRSLRSVQGWWEFRSGNTRLHVKNINVSTAETRTGADLVYVRRMPDTVVLVQYKLLEILERTAKPVFRPDGRLGRQVDRMLSYSPRELDRGAIESDARLGGDFAFVKFVLPLGTTRPATGIPEGRYFPADAVRRMLACPDDGPAGGKVHYIYQRRHIDGETFARLVRDRWIGSTGHATQLLRNVLGLAPAREREPLTLAVEERV
jgi:hypothetical protein